MSMLQGLWLLRLTSCYLGEAFVSQGQIVHLEFLHSSNEAVTNVKGRERETEWFRYISIELDLLITSYDKFDFIVISHN